MEWVAIITVVALLQCALFSFVVGRARVKYWGIPCVFAGSLSQDHVSKEPKVGFFFFFGGGIGIGLCGH